MRRFLPTAAIALVAGAAIAEEAADVETLARCLEEAEAETVNALFDACVTRVSEPCIARSQQTTTDIAGCLGREHEAWEVLLEEQWQAARQDAQQADDGRAIEQADDAPPVLDALLAAQEAWRAFREAECAHAHAEWAEGSFRVLAAALCQRNMTARRAIQFHQKAAIR